MSFARQSLGSLAALVIGVLVSVLLPRILGPDARGEYQLAVKVAGLVLAVAQWGIPEVLLQALADGRASQGVLIGTALVLGLAGAVVVALILAAAAPLFEDNLLKGVSPTLLALALGGSLASLIGLLARRFIQLGGRLDVYNGLDIGRTILFLILVIVGGVLLPRQALGPTLGWLGGELALALVAMLFLVRHTQRWSVNEKVARDLATAGAPIQFGLIGMFVGSEGGAFVLNANLDIAAVGIYAVAMSVSRLVLQISVALRTALQPRLMGTEQDSGAMTARVTRHGLLWMVLIAVCLAVGSPLAPLIFGRDFSEVTPVLVLLLPGMVAYGVWQLLASHLLRIGRRRFLAGVAWLFGITSIVLQALGAEWFGLTGAAAGLSVAYLLATVVILVAFLQVSGQRLRELLPAGSDVAFYVGLTRRALARNAA